MTKNAFHPFSYGQRVTWIDYADDGGGTGETWLTGKVQGVCDEPDLLFVSIDGGATATVLRARLHAVTEGDEIEEGGGDRCDFTDRAARMSVPEDPPEFTALAREVDRRLSSNPKDAIGASKAGLAFVPMGPLYLVGLAMLEGAIKYGPFNWRDSAVDNRIYIEAAQRHIHKYWNGETYDPTTGIHHIAYAIAGMLVMLDAEQNGKLIDTRPTPMRDGLIDEISALVPGVVKFAEGERDKRLAKQAASA